MSPFEERNAQTVAMIRREIAICKERAKDCGWHPTSTAWHRAFGELSGLHRALELIEAKMP